MCDLSAGPALTPSRLRKRGNPFRPSGRTPPGDIEDRWTAVRIDPPPGPEPADLGLGWERPTWPSRTELS
jgi:hypothetical protein